MPAIARGFDSLNPLAMSGKLLASINVLSTSTYATVSFLSDPDRASMIGSMAALPMPASLASALRASLLAASPVALISAIRRSAFIVLRKLMQYRGLLRAAHYATRLSHPIVDCRYNSRPFSGLPVYAPDD